MLCPGAGSNTVVTLIIRTIRPAEVKLLQCLLHLSVQEEKAQIKGLKYRCLRRYDLNKTISGSVYKCNRLLVLCDKDMLLKMT